MRVSRSRKPLQHFYSLGNEILQEVSDAKYLGIQIDWLALHLKVGSGRGLRRNITATSYNSHNSPNLSSTLKKKIMLK